MPEKVTTGTAGETGAALRAVTAPDFRAGFELGIMGIELGRVQRAGLGYSLGHRAGFNARAHYFADNGARPDARAEEVLYRRAWDNFIRAYNRAQAA